MVSASPVLWKGVPEVPCFYNERQDKEGETRAKEREEGWGGICRLWQEWRGKGLWERAGVQELGTLSTSGLGRRRQEGDGREAYVP